MIKNIILADIASMNSPTCSDKWLALTQDERLTNLNQLLHINKDLFDSLEIVDALDSGYVTVRFKKNFSADVRGGILLDFEEQIKTRLDYGLTVWLEPLADKSNLRKLRGIEVKKS